LRAELRAPFCASPDPRRSVRAEKMAGRARAARAPTKIACQRKKGCALAGTSLLMVQADQPARVQRVGAVESMPDVLPGTGIELPDCGVSVDTESRDFTTREAASAGMVLSMPDVLPGTGTELVLVGSVTTGASRVVVMVEAASAGMVLSMPEELPGTGTLLVFSVVLATGAG